MTSSEAQSYKEVKASPPTPLQVGRGDKSGQEINRKIIKLKNK
jgi:hypothetical protein